MDIMGPLPRTARKGRHILIVMDYFTRWAEAVVLPDQEAETVARAFVTEVVCRLGPPATIHTDQGRNFQAKMFREVHRLLGTAQTRTCPYNPKSDGLVERCNRTVEAMLAMTIDKHQSDWDLQLPFVMSAYRASVQASTNQTPNFLMLGRETQAPLSLLYPLPGEDDPADPTDFAAELQTRMAAAHDYARIQSGAAVRRQERNYSGRVRGEELAVGDLVYYMVRVKEVGKCPKFMEPWSGPWKVIRSLGGPVWEIQMGRKKRVVHYDLLKKAPVVVAGHREEARAVRKTAEAGAAERAAEYVAEQVAETDGPVAPPDGEAGEAGTAGPRSAKTPGRRAVATPPGGSPTNGDAAAAGSHGNGDDPPKSVRREDDGPFAAMGSVGKVEWRGRGQRWCASYIPTGERARERVVGLRRETLERERRERRGHGKRVQEEEGKVGGWREEIELPIDLRFPKDRPELEPTSIVGPPEEEWVLFIPTEKHVKVLRWTPGEEVFSPQAIICPRQTGESITQMSRRVAAIFAEKNRRFAENDGREKKAAEDRSTAARRKGGATRRGETQPHRGGAQAAEGQSTATRRKGGATWSGGTESHRGEIRRDDLVSRKRGAAEPVYTGWANGEDYWEEESEGSEMFKCSLCEMTASRADTLRRHMLECHADRGVGWNCPVHGCEYQAKGRRWEDLAGHLTKSTPDTHGWSCPGRRGPQPPKSNTA